MTLLSKNSLLLQGGVVFLVCIVAVSSKEGTEDDKPGFFVLQHRYLKGAILEDDAMFTDLFPLQPTDYIGFVAAVAGLMLAAGGGIGGGGILVPIYILLFEFPVKRTYSYNRCLSLCSKYQHPSAFVALFLLLLQMPFLWHQLQF